ncbi:hypothetical protein MASR2M48_23720 [Spirochaetota bacterium]
MPRYVSVAFDVPVDRQWSYANPEGMDAPIGSRVEAALGRRTAIGWVVALSDTVDIDPSRINLAKARGRRASLWPRNPCPRLLAGRHVLLFTG